MEARRCRGIIEPPIVALKRRLFPSGVVPAGCLDLNQAVPSHAPPAVLLEAAGRAAADPASARYTEDHGLGPLREAVARHLSDRHGADLFAGEVLVTAGANLGFTLLTQALCAADRDARIVTPYYFNHPMAIGLAGGRLSEWRLPAGLSIAEAVRAGRLDAAAGELIVLVNPCNPTGRCHSRADLAALLGLVRERGAFLILDETYLEFFPLDREPVTLLELPGWREHAAVVGTFSKSLAITGHRIGYVCAAEPLLEELLKVQDTFVICASHVGQLGALAALRWDGLEGWQAERRAEMDARVRAFREALEEEDSGFVVESSGAFFVYLRHSFGVGSWDLAERLVREAGVFVLPGACCGAEEDDRIRVAVGNADEATLVTAARRLGRLGSGSPRA